MKQTLQAFWNWMGNRSKAAEVSVHDVYSRETAAHLSTVKDCSPVMALPRIRAWMSWVPTKDDNNQCVWKKKKVTQSSLQINGCIGMYIRTSSLLYSVLYQVFPPGFFVIIYETFYVYKYLQQRPRSIRLNQIKKHDKTLK